MRIMWYFLNICIIIHGILIVLVLLMLYTHLIFPDTQLASRSFFGAEAFERPWGGFKLIISRVAHMLPTCKDGFLDFTYCIF